MKLMKTQKRKCPEYSILNLNTNRCRKCPAKNIKRNSYIRKSKKTGIKTYVHEKCILSRGLPGKTSLRYGADLPGIGKIKKGELGKHGYHSVLKLSKTARERALVSAVGEYGANRIVKKLGAIRTYLKHTSPESSAIFYRDQCWVRRKYAHSFKGTLKKSKLYTNII